MKSKTKISISLKKELVNYMNDLNLNKSKFIENLIIEFKKNSTKYDFNKTS